MLSHSYCTLTCWISPALALQTSTMTESGYLTLSFLENFARKKMNRTKPDSTFDEASAVYFPLNIEAFCNHGGIIIFKSSEIYLALENLPSDISKCRMSGSLSTPL